MHASVTNVSTPDTIDKQAVQNEYADYFMATMLADRTEAGAQCPRVLGEGDEMPDIEECGREFMADMISDGEISSSSAESGSLDSSSSTTRSIVSELAVTNWQAFTCSTSDSESESDKEHEQQPTACTQ